MGSKISRVNPAANDSRVPGWERWEQSHNDRVREAYLRDNSQSPDKARRLAKDRDNQIKQQQREFDKYKTTNGGRKSRKSRKSKNLENLKEQNNNNKTYICVINYNNTNHIINKLQIIYNICNRG